MINKLRYTEVRHRENEVLVSFPTNTSVLIPKRDIERIEGGNIYFVSKEVALTTMQKALDVYVPDR